MLELCYAKCSRDWNQKGDSYLNAKWIEHNAHTPNQPSYLTFEDYEGLGID